MPDSELIKRTRLTINVTTHAKQRLYDRFNKLCFGRADFKEIIQDAFIMGEVDREFDGSVLRVVWGNIGMVAAMSNDSYLVLTVVDMSKRYTEDEMPTISRGNRYNKGQRKKLINLRNKSNKRINKLSQSNSRY